MDVYQIIVYVGYFSLVLLMLNLPLFVYSIFEYKKHPLFSKIITRRNRVTVTFLLGGSRLIVSVFAAGYFVQVVNESTFSQASMRALLFDVILMSIMAIASVYVTVIVPVRESARESEKRAEYLLRKRREHRAKYLEASSEKNESRVFK